jgi:hypothetical protein
MLIAEYGIPVIPPLPVLQAVAQVHNCYSYQSGLVPVLVQVQVLVLRSIATGTSTAGISLTVPLELYLYSVLENQYGVSAPAVYAELNVDYTPPQLLNGLLDSAGRSAAARCCVCARAFLR